MRVSNKERWLEIVKKTGKCGLCPRHGGENTTRKRDSHSWKNNRKNQYRNAGVSRLKGWEVAFA